MRSREVAIGVAAVVAGTLLRAPAIAQDLCLDEVWCLQDASGLRSAFDAFRITLDNNHLLVTFWMYALGVLDSPIVYRLPSLIAGIAAIVLAHHVGRRRSEHCAFVYPIVFAIWFPLLVYSVEARGYALAVGFALAAYALFEDPTPLDFAHIAGLWACIVLGFLAHLTFAYVYGALGVWSVVRCVRSRIGLGRSALRLIALHGVPCSFLAVLYVVMLKDLYSAGGNDWRYADVLAETLAWACGVPVAIGLVPLAVMAALVLAWDTHARWRAGSDSFVFFPLVVVVLPLALTLVREPRLLAPRYFLLSIAFFLLPLSAALAQLLHVRRALGVAALLAVAATNLSASARFIELGRGHYADALRYIAAHTQGDEIRVGSDHDVRNARLLAYYAQWLHTGQRVVYVPHADREPDAPRWLILHSFDQPPAPRSALVIKSGAAYRLRETFRYWGPSGLHWFVYERVDEHSPAANRT